MDRYKIETAQGLALLDYIIIAVGRDKVHQNIHRRKYTEAKQCDNRKERRVRKSEKH